MVRQVIVRNAATPRKQARPGISRGLKIHHLLVQMWEDRIAKHPGLKRLALDCAHGPSLWRPLGNGIVQPEAEG